MESGILYGMRLTGQLCEHKQDKLSIGFQEAAS